MCLLLYSVSVNMHSFCLSVPSNFYRSLTNVRTPTSCLGSWRRSWPYFILLHSGSGGRIGGLLCEQMSRFSTYLIWCATCVLRECRLHAPSSLTVTPSSTEGWYQTQPFSVTWVSVWCTGVFYICCDEGRHHRHHCSWFSSRPCSLQEFTLSSVFCLLLGVQLT